MRASAAGLRAGRPVLASLLHPLEDAATRCQSKMSSITSKTFFQLDFFFFFFLFFSCLATKPAANSPQSPVFAVRVGVGLAGFAGLGRFPRVCAVFCAASGRIFCADSGAPQVPHTSACTATSGTKVDCTPQ